MLEFVLARAVTARVCLTVTLLPSAPCAWTPGISPRAKQVVLGCHVWFVETKTEDEAMLPLSAVAEQWAFAYVGSKLEHVLSLTGS